MRRSAIKSMSETGLSLALLLLIVSASNSAPYLDESAADADSHVLEANDGDDFLLLSQRDISQNVDILEQLSSSSKEEIEEIIASSPAVQNIIIGKIRNVIRLKEAKGPNGASRPITTNADQFSNNNNNDYHHDHRHNYPPKVKGLKKKGYLEEDDEDMENGEDESYSGKFKKSPMDEDTVAMLREKMGDKKSKLYKIGRKLKEKIVKLKGKLEKTKKKKRPNQGDEGEEDQFEESSVKTMPKFHFTVLTSTSKQATV